MLRTGESAKQQEHRRRLQESFQTIKEKNTKRLEIQRQQRLQLREGKDSDLSLDQRMFEEQTVEILLKTEEVEYKA